MCGVLTVCSSTIRREKNQKRKGKFAGVWEEGGNDHQRYDIGQVITDSLLASPQDFVCLWICTTFHLSMCLILPFLF